VRSEIQIRNLMHFDLIISGVGGQGIITIANLIGFTALEEKYDAKQSEVHGMSQRGGSVETQIRIADYKIASGIIPVGEADLVISMEPMESLRYLPWLKQSGWLITHDRPIINIENYPDIELLLKEIEKIPCHLLFNAEELAHKAGSSKSTNMVLLGAASPLLPFRQSTIINCIKYFFRNKEDRMIEANLKAFESGLELAEKKLIPHFLQNGIYYDQ
jgi:indolepyruvate ferredoxin oxidoreductase beta subunit